MDYMIAKIIREKHRFINFIQFQQTLVIYNLLDQILQIFIKNMIFYNLVH
jgi:hypothetical protein